MDFQTLNLLFRCSKQFSHEKIRMQDLNDTECMICSYIYSHENCSQDEVAIALKIDKTTVAKALLNLEKKTCVERTSDMEDKRRKCLKLTKAGCEKISKLLDIHNNWLSSIMTCLSEEEKNQFENLCRRLLDAAEKLTRENERNH